MTDTDAAKEREWWGSLVGEEIFHNTWSNPPYDPMPVVEFIHDRIGDACAVVDLGAGPGRLAQYVQTMGDAYAVAGLASPEHRVVHCIDIAENMVAEARRRGLLATMCDGRRIPIGTGTVDAVYSVTMLQHIPKGAQAAYVGEMARILRPGGVALFTFVERGAEGIEDQFLSHHVDRSLYLTWTRRVGFGRLEWLGPAPGTHPQWVWCAAVKTQQQVPPGGDRFPPRSRPTPPPPPAPACCGRCKHPVRSHMSRTNPDGFYDAGCTEPGCGCGFGFEVENKENR